MTTPEAEQPDTPTDPEAEADPQAEAVDAEGIQASAGDQGPVEDTVKNSMSNIRLQAGSVSSALIMCSPGKPGTAAKYSNLP